MDRADENGERIGNGYQFAWIAKKCYGTAFWFTQYSSRYFGGCSTAQKTGPDQNRQGWLFDCTLVPEKQDKDFVDPPTRC
jgi:hypothetical protein